MTIYRKFDNIDGTFAASIGFFDGVHCGHRFLIEHLKREAESRKMKSAVITFLRHPKALLHPEEPLQLINSYEEKMQNLAETGIDACFVLDFTSAVRNLTAQEFICQVLSEQMHIRALLIGYDHRFGRNRAEGFTDYVRYGQMCGMEIIQEPVFNDGSELHYSSSEVRRALLCGNIQQATTLLGQPYRLKGTVIGGHRLGRTIGFPTANLMPDDKEKIIPMVGVYAIWAILADGRTFPAMLNIGSRPTVNRVESNITLETHIIGFEGDLYNQPLTLVFIARMRDEVKMDSLEALQTQLSHDAAHALALLR